MQEIGDALTGPRGVKGASQPSSLVDTDGRDVRRICELVAVARMNERDPCKFACLCELALPVCVGRRTAQGLTVRNGRLEPLVDFLFGYGVEVVADC